MSKVTRKTADYFKSLPKADPLKDAPMEAEKNLSTERAAQALLPDWANQDRMELDSDGSTRLLPKDSSWEHLADTSESIENEEAASKPGAQKRRSLFNMLIDEKLDAKSESPTSIVKNSDISLQDSTRKNLKASWDDGPLERLRSLGVEFAKEHDGALSPSFLRNNVEGVSTSDYPLPGTSFAVMGVRGSFGRTEVNSASIETDRLFSDRKDLRHAGAPDLRSSPLNIDQARGMRPGERFRISAERSVLAEAGLKYTLTPLPGVTSGAFYDIGPAGQIDATVAVEGETSIELVRGFKSEVAVIVSARDERSAPTQDRSWKASVGAFFDSSLFEYLGENFRKMVRQGTEEKLYNLEDKKRNADLRLTPIVDKGNAIASASVEKRSKKTEGRVTLYELVLDLDKPEARKVFKKLAGHTGQREIDFSALENLGDDSGVQVLRNHLQKASTHSVEKAVRAFGFARSTIKTEETLDSTASWDPKVKRQKNIAFEEKNESLSGSRSTTTIGRVSTYDDPDKESTTGVGFGMELKVQNKAMRALELEEVLSFAALTSDDEETVKSLDNLREKMPGLARRSFLGASLFAKHTGETDTSVRLELNAEGTAALFELTRSDEGMQKLWTQVSKTYAAHHKLDKAPKWPIKSLNGDKILHKLRRGLPTLTNQSGDFLAARTAMLGLKAAADQQDPNVAAKHLSEAFQSLDLGMVAGILNAAKAECAGGLSVVTEIEGAKVLSAPPPAATSAADGSRAQD